ncbi:sensor histidine kinase [Idiomarina seosinensis]|uniref:sensor histidine kinase n=1 Tax=Idiomarina seosinensis TaxID=281739 RepID=UPI00384CD360
MFTLASFCLARRSHWVISFGLVLDISVANALLAISGGISNPFSTLLLIFVVVGVLLLPWAPALLILVVSILGQMAQLLLPMVFSSGLGHARHEMSDSFLAHSQGMVLSFVIAALIIWISSFLLKRRLIFSQQQVQELRERQLRDEQLLTIGSAAAQLTHDLATPVQTINLLIEELSDTLNPDQLQPLQTETQKVNASLQQWRQSADDIRARRRHRYPLTKVSQELRQLFAVIVPESPAIWNVDEPSPTDAIICDRTLFPAIVNLIVNASRTEHSSPAIVSITVCRRQQVLRITIENHSNDATSAMATLGIRIQKSSEGTGIGAVISHATIERHGGDVSWQQVGNSIQTEVRLPLAQENKDE